MSGADPRAESRESWEASAPAWERRNDDVARVGARVAERMIELLDPQPGETVLDVAAGVGDTGFLAARALEPGGRLISTDLADGMVEAAQRRAAVLGLTNVEHTRASAEELPLGDASVDGALCRWGFMLMPDPAAALGEARRVLRPGGRLVFAVWAEPDRNPWATIIGRVLVQRGYLPPPDPAQPGMFVLADRERLRALVLGAGFDGVELEDVELVGTYRSFEHYWETSIDLATSLREALAALPEEERADVKATARSNAGPFLGEDGMRVAGACIVALARCAGA